MRVPLPSQVCSALLPGVPPDNGVVSVATEAQALALGLWFGSAWRGSPAVPVETGPSGTTDELALMAADVAAIAADPTELNQPINWDGLRMRARAALRAERSAAPVRTRAGHSRTDVQVLDRKLPYARYFDTEDMTLRHPTFAGGLSEPVMRTVLRAADAVTVLPYDPATDRVLLVEQFRPGAFSRGDPHPWVLEPVAGRCDGDEPVEEVARREALEEAGLSLGTLHLIGGYYPSPGAMSEYLTSFVGQCDLAGHDAGLHGLDTEGEDIRTHVLDFQAAWTLIETGEADNGPLLLSLFWLQANRARLRG